MMSWPAPITPPTVLMRMFFTTPRSGALISERVTGSARAAMVSSLCASSASTRTSSVLASDWNLLRRSVICNCNSFAWRFMRRISTSDTTPLAAIGSVMAISRSSSRLLSRRPCTDSFTARTRDW